MSRLFFHENPPWNAGWAADGLLIHDRVLAKGPAFRAWAKRFPATYAVKGGEGLKDIRAFPGHVLRIQKLAGGFANRRLTIVVAGGGSVGDFGGFVASVFKRGVRLVHVPTTWLAALDSAHGGKNGLNVGGVKNQLGTIYPAAEVHHVAAFLKTQPLERAFEAGGEVLKMAMLKGGATARASWPAGRGFDGLWKALPAVIRGKTSIVAKDPFEKTGVRHLLNLGHTMGHVFESALGIPHGTAVTLGLAFAADFSRAKGICTESAYARIASHPLWPALITPGMMLRALSIPGSAMRRGLLQDKKRTGGSKVRFVFLKDVGRPVIREVTVDEIVREARRQKENLRDRKAPRKGRS